MKALTLWQPWATLVAFGVKTVETRGWSTSYRGPLAIHAAATLPSYQKRYVSGATVSRDAWGDWRLHFSPTPSAPMPKGLPAPEYGEVTYPLPLGAVVATCTVVDVVPMVGHQDAIPERGGFCHIGPGGIWLRGFDANRDIEDQRPYGDFTPGRYAWLLGDVVPQEPVPAKGRQGLWEWEPTSARAEQRSKA